MNLSPKRITQLCRVVTGKTPPTSRQEFFGGEYLFVTPSDLDYCHYYCRKTERTVSEEARSLLPNQFVPADSVMFTCIGATIGKCGTGTCGVSNKPTDQFRHCKRSHQCEVPVLPTLPQYRCRKGSRGRISDANCKQVKV
jgi:hypothetical protein